MANCSGGHTKEDQENHELFLNRKKLKEAETQLRSLSLILETNSSKHCNEINFEALKKNKTVLENRVAELKECISYHIEDVIPKGGINGSNASTDLDERENEQISENWVHRDTHDVCDSFEESGSSRNVSEWLDKSELSEGSECREDDLKLATDEDESNSSEYLREENARLRRRLSEARQKHKAERQRVIEQLRILEVEAVDGERKWANELQMKQVELEKMLERIQQLQNKNEELTVVLKDGEKLRKKESKQCNDTVKQKQEIISELEEKLATVASEKTKLEDDLKGVRKLLEAAETNVEQLTERQKDLQDELWDKNQTIEKRNKELVKCAEEMEQTRKQFESLQNEVGNLEQDKISLTEQLEMLTNNLNNDRLKVTTLTNEKELLQGRFFVDVNLKTSVKEDTHDTITDENPQKKKLDLGSESAISKEEKLDSNETNDHHRTQDENQSLNKDEMATHQKILLPQNREKFSDSMQEIIQKMKAQLACIQKDVTRHKENVDTLGDKWRKYKSSLQEIHQSFSTKSRMIFPRTEDEMVSDPISMK